MTLVNNKFNVPVEYYKLYSPYKQSIQVIKYLKYYVKDLGKLLITDSTAGIGGNSLLFCRYFGYVNAVENNIEAIKYITKNLNSFKNKTIINCNYLDIFLTIKQDVIFLDPPWGTYRDSNNPNLYLSGYNANYLISILYDYAEIVILKAPLNYKNNKCNKWKIIIHPVNGYNKHLYNLYFYLKDSVNLKDSINLKEK